MISSLLQSLFIITLGFANESWCDDASPVRAVSESSHWGYKHMTDEIEPGLWSLLYPQCSGTRQSPIPIDTIKTVLSSALGPLTFDSYDQHPNYWTVVNNGHVVQFSANFDRSPIVAGGGLDDQYEFRQFHFHWGHSDSAGSEHVIDGKQYPLELHIVHRRIKDTDTSMTSDSIGIAVVGVLFQVAPENSPPNPHFEALTRAIETVVYKDETRNITLPEVELIDLVPAATQYYRYLGSLTTPPCAEAVVWTVMADPWNITEEQLNRFRELHERGRQSPNVTAILAKNDWLSDNYRQLQPLDGRTIQYFPGQDTSFAHGSTAVSSGPIVELHVSSANLPACHTVLLLLVSLVFLSSALRLS